MTHAAASHLSILNHISSRSPTSKGRSTGGPRSAMRTRSSWTLAAAAVCFCSMRRPRNRSRITWESSSTIRKAAGGPAGFGSERSRTRVCWAGTPASALEKFVTPASVDAVHVYFPDPWWKRKHKRRRLFTDEFVDLAARRAQTGRAAAFLDGRVGLLRRDPRSYGSPCGLRDPRAPRRTRSRERSRLSDKLRAPPTANGRDDLPRLMAKTLTPRFSDLKGIWVPLAAALGRQCLVQSHWRARAPASGTRVLALRGCDGEL